MIELIGFTKKYGDFTAVDDISFTVNKGEIVGLLGPNGAGKSTVLKALTGFHFPTSGRVNIAEKDVVECPVETKRLIGYLPERLPLYEESTVLEYLEFIAAARQIPSPSKRIKGVVEQFELAKVIHTPINHLSKGYKQRVGLAQALIHDPAIVILDEPTNGLDPNQIQEYRRHIKSLGPDKTILLSSHIMQEIEALCDRIIILHQGRVRASGTAAEIQKELKGAEKLKIQAKGLTATDFEGLECVLGCTEYAQTPEYTEYNLTVHPGGKSREAVFQLAVSKGAVLIGMEVVENSLEELFSTLTRKTGAHTDSKAGEV